MIPKERYDKDGTFYEKEVVLGQKIERAYNYFPIDFAINNTTVRCSALAHYYLPMIRCINW